MSENSFLWITLKILAVLALVLMNAFFVTAELAMVRIRDTQLAALPAKRSRRARRARHILTHIDAYIGATQFGITLASLGTGMAVEPVFNGILGPLFHLLAIKSISLQHHIALGVGFFTNCYLLIVAGELVPKAIAIRRTLPAALLTATPLFWFDRISFPFIWLLQSLVPVDHHLAGRQPRRPPGRPVRRGTARHPGRHRWLSRPPQPHPQRLGPAPAHRARSHAPAQ